MHGDPYCLPFSRYHFFVASGHEFFYVSRMSPRGGKGLAKRAGFGLCSEALYREVAFGFGGVVPSGGGNLPEGGGANQWKTDPF